MSVWYGSLQNRIAERVKSPKPEVGMGATALYWSDRHAYEIIAIKDDRSSTLVWQIVSNGHAYVKHSNGLKFSCEPGNPTGVYSPKYSGFANPHTVDVSFNKGKSTLNLISTSECGMKRTVTPVVIGQCNSKKLQQKVKDALKDHRPDLALPVFRRVARHALQYQKYQSSKAARRSVRNKKLGKKTGKK